MMEFTSMYSSFLFYMLYYIYAQSTSSSSWEKCFPITDGCEHLSLLFFSVISTTLHAFTISTWCLFINFSIILHFYHRHTIEYKRKQLRIIDILKKILGEKIKFITFNFENNGCALWNFKQLISFIINSLKSRQLIDCKSLIKILFRRVDDNIF